MGNRSSSGRQRLRGVVLRLAALLGVLAQARAGPETPNENEALRLRDLGRQTLTVAQVTGLDTGGDDQTGTMPEPEIPTKFNPDTGDAKGMIEQPPPPPELFPPDLPPLEEYGQEPVPRSLELPRKGVRENNPRRHKLKAAEYPDSAAGRGLPPETKPEPHRWFIGFGRWKRYADPSTETPYQTGALKLWHPYLQSLLKGDAPVHGDDIFLNLTVADFLQFEARRLPTPSGISAERPNSSEFFGRGEQYFVSNDVSIALDLFRGETAFKPVEWAIRILGVYNHNYTDVQETGVLDPDPRLKNTTRDKDFFALQEAFAEIHLRDLSDNYDFISSRTGIQPFVSDFRGFIFNDANLGVRIFGNYENNLWQYNLAWFHMLEKDTYSDLNEVNSRDQDILIANLFRQDFFAKGYTAQLSFHANFDGARRHYDKNDFIVRPAPIGKVADHYVQSYYLGWTGDGHIGWLNLSHAFYEVLGEDSLNGIAGHRVSINAQMAALELSIDKDWIRHKLSVFYASGDSNPKDGSATGFDTILDRPFFIGGPFSFYVHQGFNLAGTSVNFKQRDSLVPDLRSSKTEGQSNFVNPGAVIVGYGCDADITPKLKALANVNYIWIAATEPIREALFTNHAGNAIGLDASFGLQWRPFLTENMLVSAGIGFLVPGQGYKDIYRANTRPVPGFPGPPAGNVDDFLYSAILTVTLTY